MTPHEEEILNEQAAGHDRVLRENAEALSVAEIRERLREQVRCATCGKTRVVLQLAEYRRPYSVERVTPETHCSCPPRVECGGARYAAGPAWELVSDECEHCDHGLVVELVHGYPERSVCGACQGVGRVPKTAAQQERAS